MLIVFILKFVSALSPYGIKNEFKYDIKDIEEFFIAYNEEHLYKDNSMVLDTFIQIEKGDVVYDGKIIAIDVGGTSLKIGFYENEFYQSMFTENVIPKDGSIKNVNLFSWMAKSIESWMEQNNMDKTDSYAIALTFSYPIKLKSINEGEILGFSKDFPFAQFDLEKKHDPAKLLDEELKKLSLNMNTRVILNDTTATFVALLQQNINCNLGVVLGTGTNGAFIMNNKLVNSEWGHFDSSHIKKNIFDRMVKYYMKNRYYACIDCMIGGLKLIEVLEIIFNSKIKNILRAFYTMNKKSEANKIIISIKKRIYLILAILTVASVEGSNYILSLNGSGLSNLYDQEMYASAIKLVHKIVKGEEPVRIELYFVNNSSLLGAIHALRYGGKVGIK